MEQQFSVEKNFNTLDILPVTFADIIQCNLDSATGYTGLLYFGENPGFDEGKPYLLKFDGNCIYVSTVPLIDEVDPSFAKYGQYTFTEMDLLNIGERDDMYLVVYFMESFPDENGYSFAGIRKGGFAHHNYKNGSRCTYRRGKDSLDFIPYQNPKDSPFYGTSFPNDILQQPVWEGIDCNQYALPYMIKSFQKTYTDVYSMIYENSKNKDIQTPKQLSEFLSTLLPDLKGESYAIDIIIGELNERILGFAFYKASMKVMSQTDSYANFPRTAEDDIHKRELMAQAVKEIYDF